MALTRVKRDIDWEIGSGVPQPVLISRTWAVATTFDNPTTTDTNRVGIIVISNEDSGGGSQITGVTVGSETALEITSEFQIDGFSNDIAIFRLTDAQLQNLGTSDAINVTFDSTPDSFATISAIYANVSQSNPVVGSDTFGSASGNPPFSLTAAAESDGVSIVGIATGLTTSATITTPDYTEQINDVSGNGNSTFVFDKFTASAPTETVDGSLAASNRDVVFLVNLRKA